MTDKKGCYAKFMEELTQEVGFLVQWRTNKGEEINQMFKLLSVSRTSHLNYLKNDDSVPAYIWNQLDLLMLMTQSQRLKHALNVLVDFNTLDIQTCYRLAIKGWEQMTNRKMDDQSGSDFVGRFSARRANKKMMQVSELDPSGIKAALLMKNYLEEFVNNDHYSLSAILENGKSLDAAKTGYTLVEQCLTDSQLGDAIKLFRDKTKRAINFFKPEEYVSEDLINDSINIMLHSKRVFDRLDHYQIASDLLSSNNQQLKIQEQIYVFESIAQLIEQCSMIPNGFSLNLIRTKRETDSFFCLVIKSGGNVYLISDKPKDNVFKTDFMANRNQRYNLMRYEESYFPYELLGVTFSNKGRDATISDSTEIVVAENNLKVLGLFRDIESKSILWFTFFFEECRKKFFENMNLQLPSLGYVDEYQLNHPMLVNKTASQLPTTYVAKSSVKPKSCIELNADNLKSNNILAFGTDGGFVSKNGWMEDKFADKIDESLLYIPESLSDQLCVSHNNANKLCLSNNDDQVDSSLLIDNYKGGLKRIPTSLIGTPEEIQAEVDLIARYNKSVIIRSLLESDFKERESEVKTWLAKQIKKNLHNLVDRLVSLDHDFFCIAHRVDELKSADAKCVIEPYMYRQIHVKKMTYLYDFRSKKTELQTVLNLRDAKNRAKCAMTKVLDPTYTFYLNVDNIYDLEIITGLKQDKFPVELQGWRSQSHECASITTKFYDPVESIVSPWLGLDFKFAINLDGEFVKKRRKELGLKGRFVMPEDYFESQQMLDYLKSRPHMEGKIFAQKSKYEKPSFAFYYRG